MAMIRPETEMKDTGIEWIGNIPSSWVCCKQKYVISLINGRAFKDTEFEEDGKYRILRVGNLFSNPKWYSSNLELEDDKYCDNGDLLYAWSMSYGPYIWNGEKVIYHYHIWKAKLLNNLSKRFAYYYLIALSDSIKSDVHETTMSFITMKSMNNSYIAFPEDIFEQQAIADYLDETCSKIDEIIAEAKASIDEYKELKQSVIFEAVTKGLDKNVEMKDSGNLAIGKIPKHWVKARVKNVATRITVGVVVTPANYFDDAGTVAFLRGINVKEYVINSEPMMYITEETNKELSKTIVHTNDLVIVRDGAIGVTAVVPEKYDGANVVSMIIVSLGSEYNHDYLCYVLNSYVGKIQFNLTKIGSALSHTSVSSVSNIEIPKPSINEQIDIVNYLKEQHKKLNSLIAEKESLINDLEAYKKSLIYEVVTGKRRVV